MPLKNIKKGAAPLPPPDCKPENKSSGHNQTVANIINIKPKNSLGGIKHILAQISELNSIEKEMLFISAYPKYNRALVNYRTLKKALL